MRSRPDRPRGAVLRVAAALTLPLALGLLPLPGPAASADDPLTARAQTTDTRLAGVRRDLAASTEAMVRAVAALQSAEADLPAARRAVAKARAAVVAARRREAAAAAARGSAQVRLVATERAAAAAADAAAHRQRALGRLARAAYEEGPMQTWVAVLGARTPAELGDRVLMLSAVAGAQASAIEDLQAVSAAYDARTLDLVRARDALNEAHSRLEADVARTATAEQEAEKAAAQLTALAELRRSALGAARAAVAEDSARYAELSAAASTLQAQLRARAAVERGGNLSPVAAQPGLVSRPLYGPVTSPFGMRRHPITGVYKLHSGVDFGAPCGTPIRAAADGTVLATGFNRAYGNRVVLTHGVLGGGSLATTYNHQSSIAVSPGQQVRRGQLVGMVGTTGYSTGCHLHFELLVNGAFVDPVGWL